MGDTGSERSKPPSLPPRCPCGFWGSSKTMNLCSKCFADIQKKQPDEDCAPDTAPSTSTVISHQLKSQDPHFPAHRRGSPVQTQPTVHSPHPQNGPATQPPSQRARHRHRNGRGPTARGTGGGPKQRSRRRCHRCQTKLELVQQELGSCRCGYVFCMLHRLPEQHDCLFDHLGRGREEAVLKMVKLDRKVGRSCQRIGEECS
ncbi:hypothetical protein SKAU_G00189810 [Synaphobranchus kaupii]|uniref:Uncharacterized protein n=1 Tax=Synaphobranchus kaupii TaxID=118154 RepID=A0A9Q1FDF1_SYNKA|nr:hypothetical protein SKAU_G00189810 [Synaphobranchus kaupii]